MNIFPKKKKINKLVELLLHTLKRGDLYILFDAKENSDKH